MATLKFSTENALWEEWRCLGRYHIFFTTWSLEKKDLSSTDQRKDLFSATQQVSLPARNQSASLNPSNSNELRVVINARPGSRPLYVTRCLFTSLRNYKAAGKWWDRVKVDQTGATRFSGRGQHFRWHIGWNVVKLYTKPHNLVFTNNKGVSILI